MHRSVESVANEILNNNPFFFRAYFYSICKGGALVYVVDVIELGSHLGRVSACLDRFK
jgi:hypothetical protein